MYFIYVTTNKVNNKQYVGLCSMKKDNWKSYLGSGKLLHKAIKKYGQHNFERRIIQYCNTIEEAIIAERDFILENECHLKEEWYNIAVGFTTQGSKGKKQTEKHRIAMQKLLTGVPKDESSKQKQSKTRREKISQGVYSFNNHTEQQLNSVKSVGLSNKGKIHKKTLCIHCGNSYGPSPYARLHGDKCKLKA
jgi:group I intron endonuclease